KEEIGVLKGLSALVDHIHLVMRVEQRRLALQGRLAMNLCAQGNVDAPLLTTTQIRIGSIGSGSLWHRVSRGKNGVRGGAREGTSLRAAAGRARLNYHKPPDGFHGEMVLHLLIPDADKHASVHV